MATGGVSRGAAGGEAGEVDGTPYLAMRFVDGRSLADLLADGNGIYHGLAGQFLFRDLRHAFKVRIVAPMSLRLHNAMERMELSRGEAERHIRSSDEHRLLWGRQIFDADVNILGLLNLLEAARDGSLRQVIFASTGGAIYGEQDTHPADENRHLGSGQRQQLCPIDQQLLGRNAVFGFEIVTEPVGLWFEYGEGRHVGLLLRRIRASRSERHCHFVTGLLGRLLDTGASA